MESKALLQQMLLPCLEPLVSSFIKACECVCHINLDSCSFLDVCPANTTHMRCMACVSRCGQCREFGCLKCLVNCDGCAAKACKKCFPLCFLCEKHYCVFCKKSDRHWPTLMTPCCVCVSQVVLLSQKIPCPRATISCNTCGRLACKSYIGICIYCNRKACISCTDKCAVLHRKTRFRQPCNGHLNDGDDEGYNSRDDWKGVYEHRHRRKKRRQELLRDQ